MKYMKSYWSLIDLKCYDCPGDTRMPVSHSVALSSYYYPYRCYQLNHAGRHFGDDTFFTAKTNCQNIARGASLMRITNSDEVEMAKRFLNYNYAYIDNNYQSFWVYNFLFLKFRTHFNELKT
jgi:hypothetical protein